MSEAQIIFDAIKTYGPEVLFGIRLAKDTYQAVAGALQRKYLGHSPEVKQAAIDNASDAAHRIGRKIEALIETGELTAEQVDAALNRPDLATLLERVILDASETDSMLKHEQLAILVAEMLRHSPESPEAVATRIACEVVKNTTQRQLHLLALIYCLESLEPVDPPDENPQVRLDDYAARVETMLNPVDFVEPRHVDVMQLESLGLMTMAVWTGKYLTLRPQSHGGCRALDHYQHTYGRLQPTHSKVFERLLFIVKGDLNVQRLGTETIKTTPVGWLLGASVYSELSGTRFRFQWDD